MELQIKNFKSIQNMNFCFGKHMTLLKGTSGVGKSTILESIVWAFSGHPKRCKPLGSTSSTHVSVSIDDLIINRKSRPNSLTVFHKNKEMVDDEAQSFLNLIYGEKFQTVGFVQQNTQKNFICMTPSKKLEFLEKFTLDNDVSEIKQKVTFLIKNCKNSFIKTEAKHEVLSIQFQKMTKPPTVLLPKGSIIMFQKEKKNISELLGELLHDAEKTQILLQKASRSDAAQVLYKEEIKEIELEIKEIKLSKNSEKNLLELRDKTQENIKICEEINFLKSSIPENFDIFVKNYETIKIKQKKDIKNIEKKIKDAEIGNISHLPCPHCTNMIRVNHTTCTVIKSKKKKITKPSSAASLSISNLIEEKSRILSSISQKEKDIMRYTEILKKISKLEKKTKNTDVLRLREKLTKIQNSLKCYQSHQNLVNRQVILKKKLGDVVVCSDNIKDLQKKYNENQKNISSIRLKIKECDNCIEKCRIYNFHQEEVKKYEQKLIDLNKITELLEIKTNELIDAQTLRELINKAENIALLSTIENINNRAAVFIDSFFVEDPISVVIVPFSEVKSTKKIKASIKLNILNKGENMNLDDLSGGEKARIVLAYNLALCEITNTSLILLDEVTASLNQQLSEDVFEKISETLQDHIIISVAHQCVDGTFDKVIVLD